MAVAPKNPFPPTSHLLNRLTLFFCYLGYLRPWESAGPAALTVRALNELDSGSWPDGRRARHNTGIQDYGGRPYLHISVSFAPISLIEVEFRIDPQGL